MISMNSSLINHALSDQLAREVEEFLARGGKVKSESIQRRDIEELTPDFKRDFVISGRKPEMVKAEKKEEKEPKPKKEKVKVIKPKPEPKPKREPKPKKQVVKVVKAKPLPKPKPQPKPKKEKKEKVFTKETLRVRANQKSREEALKKGLDTFEGECKKHGMTVFKIHSDAFRCRECAELDKQRRTEAKRAKRDQREVRNEDRKKAAIASGHTKFDAECLHHGLTEHHLTRNSRNHTIMVCTLCKKETNKRTVERRKKVQYRDYERNSFIRNELFDRRISCVALAEAISASPSTMNKIKRGEQLCSDRLWQAVNQFFEKLDK